MRTAISPLFAMSTLRNMVAALLARPLFSKETCRVAKDCPAPGSAAGAAVDLVGRHSRLFPALDTVRQDADEDVAGALCAIRGAFCRAAPAARAVEHQWDSLRRWQEVQGVVAAAGQERRPRNDSVFLPGALPVRVVQPRW